MASETSVLNQLTDISVSKTSLTGPYYISACGEQLRYLDHTNTSTISRQVHTKQFYTEEQLLQFKSKLSKAISGDITTNIEIESENKIATDGIIDINIKGKTGNTILFEVTFNSTPGLSDSSYTLAHVTDEYRVITKYVTLSIEKTKFLRNRITELVDPQQIPPDTESEIGSMDEISLHIEPYSTDNLFDSDYSARTDVYEIGSINGEQLQVISRYRKGDVLLKLDSTQMLGYTSVMTDNEEQIAMPEEPNDYGYIIVQPGIYKIWDTYTI